MTTLYRKSYRILFEIMFENVQTEFFTDRLIDRPKFEDSNRCLQVLFFSYFLDHEMIIKYYKAMTYCFNFLANAEVRTLFQFNNKEFHIDA